MLSRVRFIPNAEHLTCCQTSCVCGAYNIVREVAIPTLFHNYCCEVLCIESFDVHHSNDYKYHIPFCVYIAKRDLCGIFAKVNGITSMPQQ